MKFGWLLKAEGEVRKVSPANGKDFKYEELTKFVDGFIEIVYVSDTEILVINEEGKIQDKPINEKATQLTLGILAGDDYIVGDVILCTKDMVK